MAIWMAGIDHTTAGLDIRSVFSFTKKRTAQAYEDFRSVPGLEGSVILSTCNRMELWLSISPREDFSPVDMLCRYLDVPGEKYASYFTVRRGREAADHLFRLAAGMESRIVGEDQILTQVGDALALARSCYATDHTLEVLFRLAVTGGKRVKTEAALSTADQSVIHTALRMLEAEGVSVGGRRCMVIGNGMMGRLSAQALMDRGADVTVTVRQYRSGVVDIPVGARRINYADRLDLLPRCDFVVSATSSPNYTLKRSELASLTVDHPIRLIDLAVPRDIDPDCASLPWAALYDIDSFRIDARSEKLLSAMARAQGILAEEEDRFYAWYQGRDFVPQIQRLKEEAGADVSGRMTPALRRSRLGDDKKKELSREVSEASGRMMSHLLFEMRTRLPNEVFRECLDAMELVFQEK